VRGLDWRGVAVVLLVVGVFTVLIIGAVGVVQNPNRTASTEEVATVSAVLGSAIGAIAVYLGTKANGKPPTAPPQLPPGGPSEPSDPPGQPPDPGPPAA
jgi:hypothetical protein